MTTRTKDYLYGAVFGFILGWGCGLIIALTVTTSYTTITSKENNAMSKRYTLEDDLMPIIDGKVTLPNFVAQPLDEVANAIAAGGHSMLPKWGWASHDGQRKQWAQFFLTAAGMGSAQHGSFDGRGYVFIYRSREPIVGTFAICRHEKIDAPGANHQRGWHPGSCRKCGMDMTVDSGD